MKNRKSVAFLLALLLCAAMPLAALADRYITSDGKTGMFMMHIDDDKLLSAVVGIGIDQINGFGDRDFAAMRDEASASQNEVTAIETVPAAGITSLSVKSQLSGIIVEETDAADIEVAYVGVSDPAQISVDTSTEGGKLTVTVEGKNDELRYMSIEPGRVVGAVCISVPKHLLASITIDDTMSLYSLSADAEIAGSTQQGVLYIAYSDIASPITLETGNGTLVVDGEIITAPITLTCSNGDCIVTADTVSAPVNLRASNGDLHLLADTITEASLIVSNGDAEARIGEILSRLHLEAGNGDLEVRFTREPQNLRLDLTRGNGDMELPRGWKDGHTIGNGEPVLSLKIGNGDAEVEIDR